MEFSYGIVTATEIAYYTYIYAKITPEHYKKATSFVRAATLFGKFLSGSLAQILVSTGAMDYHQLNYISLCDVSLACIVAVCLPGVSKSIYFHQKKQKPAPEEQKRDELDSSSDTTLTPVKYESTMTLSSQIEDIPENVADSQQSWTTTSRNFSEQNIDMSSSDVTIITQSFPQTNSSDVLVANDEEYERVPCGQVFKVIWEDFKSAYTDPFQIKWCLWWALGTCTYEQVGNYIQTLWEEIYPSQDHEDLYNGAVDAINTLLGKCQQHASGHLPIFHTMLHMPPILEMRSKEHLI